MKKLVAMLLAMVLVLGLLAGCTGSGDGGNNDTPNNTPSNNNSNSENNGTTAPIDVKMGGDLVIAVKKSPTAFGYPPKCSGGDRDVVAPIFDRLIGLDDDGNYIPELAESWEYSDDFLTLTLNLQQGVKYHDGTDFNAESVVKDLTYLIPPQSNILTGITSVEATGDYTVTINLEYYNNLILYQLASAYECYMFSPTALEKNGEDWMKTHPVGTGPFSMETYEPDSYVRLVKNQDYWGGAVPLDTITFRVVSESTTQQLSFENHELNGIFDSSVNVTVALRNAGANVKIAPGAIYGIVFDRETNPALNDVRVRQAIEYAIDKEAICNGPGYGLYIPAYQAVPTDNPAYNADLEPRTYDPEKARQLLAEAGYADGLTLDMFVLETYWKEGPVAVQDYLADVGITLNLNLGNQAAYNDVRVAGNISPGTMSQSTMNVFSNPLYTLDFYWKAEPDYFSFIKHPAECDTLLQQAKQAETMDEVYELCKEINRLVYEDASFIPLWINPRMVVLDDTVMEDGYFVSGDSNIVYLGNNTWLND